MKNYKFATVFATLYLIIYTVLQQLSAPLPVLGVLFLLSPVVVIWMAYTIIRYAPYNGKEYGGEIPDDELRGTN